MAPGEVVVPARPYGVDDLVNDVIAASDHLEIDRVRLLGFALGTDGFSSYREPLTAVVDRPDLVAPAVADHLAGNGCASPVKGTV